MLANPSVKIAFHTIVPVTNIIAFSTIFEDHFITTIEAKKLHKIRLLFYNFFLLGYYSLMAGDKILGQYIGFSTKNRGLVTLVIFLPTNIMMFYDLFFN